MLSELGTEVIEGMSPRVSQERAFLVPGTVSANPWGGSAWTGGGGGDVGHGDMDFCSERREHSSDMLRRCFHQTIPTAELKPECRAEGGRAESREGGHCWGCHRENGRGVERNGPILCRPWKGEPLVLVLEQIIIGGKDRSLDTPTLWPEQQEGWHCSQVETADGGADGWSREFGMPVTSHI